MIIAGGGTAGHIFPGVAIAVELRERHPGMMIHFAIGGSALEKRILEREGIPSITIRSGALRGKSIPEKARSIGRVVRGVAESRTAVRRLRAELIIGVGGYVSAPMMVAGILLRKKTLLHEQNYIPGLTNRLLAPLVDEIAVSFPDTTRYLRGRGSWTGNPIRKGFGPPCPLPRSDGGPIRLLVFGGSQGARRINEVLVGALSRLERLPGGVEIVHSTGEIDYEWVAAAHARSGIRSRVAPFLDEMDRSYAEADLVICRAGATSCAELTAAGRPAILIPFPRSAGGHQERNAEQIARGGGAVVIRETDLTPESLAGSVGSLLAEAGRLGKMAAASAALGAPDAASRVVDIADKLLQAN